MKSIQIPLSLDSVAFVEFPSDATADSLNEVIHYLLWLRHTLETKGNRKIAAAIEERGESGSLARKIEQ